MRLKKNLTRTIFLLFVFFTTFFNSWGQNTLEYFLLKRVNDLRDSLHLPKLKLDAILNLAGDDHAYYIADKKNLTHFQKTFLKETPAERIYFYKGNRTYTGENIASITPTWISKDVLDTKANAEQLFKAWFHSPPHYQNLINPMFTKMGVGVRMSNNGLLYAAQVFSSDQITLPSYFKNEKLAWGIRKAEVDCKALPVVYETMLFANSVIVEGNSIYMKYHDLNYFKNVIQNENDGFAVDIVVREQVPCNQENQFHISEVFDGEMQQPIYNYDLFRNNISQNPNKIKVKIGEVPPYLSNHQWEANIIVINDNKLCDYAIPVYIQSDILPLIKIPIYNLDSSQLANHEKTSVRIKDSITVDLNFDRNKGKFSDFQEFNYLTLLSWGPYAKNIKVNCFASVEGPTWLNEQLLEKRKDAISTLLTENDFTFNTISFATSENWGKMKEQILKNNLNELAGKSQPQIKYFFKKNLNPYYDSLLNEQRVSTIYAIMDTLLPISSFEDYQMAKYYDNKLNSKKIDWNKILFHQYILPDYPIESELIDSLVNEKYTKTNLIGAACNESVVGYLDSLRAEKLVQNLDENDSKQLFNAANFLSQYWFVHFAKDDKLKGVAKTISPDALLALMKEIDSTKIPQKNIERLLMNVYLSGIHYYSAHNQWNATNKYFDQIVQLVKTNNFKQEDAISLALFCNYFHQFEETIKILEPYFDNSTLQESGLFILAETATLLRGTIEEERYFSFMNGAKKSNKSRYCRWLDSSFQIQRYEKLKHEFCQECR